MSFAVGIGGTGIANAATIDANDLPAHARVVMTSKSAVVVNGNNITINGVTYTQEEFQKVLDQAILDENGGRKKVHAAFAPAIAAGAYFIPGIGEVLIFGTGAIIVGGATIWATNKATSWLFNKVQNYLVNSGQAREISDARNQLPGYIKDSRGNVDMGKFKTPVRGSKDKKGPKGWRISPDRDGHRGSKWKVLDPKGQRKASVKDNGEVVGK